MYIYIYIYIIFYLIYYDFEATSHVRCIEKIVLKIKKTKKTI
jgi:hypothetical protein